MNCRFVNVDTKVSCTNDVSSNGYCKEHSQTLQARLHKTTIYTLNNVNYALIDGVVVAYVHGLEHRPLTNKHIDDLIEKNIPIHPHILKRV